VIVCVLEYLIKVDLENMNQLDQVISLKQVRTSIVLMFPKYFC